MIILLPGGDDERSLARARGKTGHLMFPYLPGGDDERSLARARGKTGHLMFPYPSEHGWQAAKGV